MLFTITVIIIQEKWGRTSAALNTKMTIWSIMILGMVVRRLRTGIFICFIILLNLTIALWKLQKTCLNAIRNTEI